MVRPSEISGRDVGNRFVQRFWFRQASWDYRRQRAPCTSTAQGRLLSRYTQGSRKSKGQKRGTSDFLEPEHHLKNSLWSGFLRMAHCSLCFDCWGLLIYLDHDHLMSGPTSPPRFQCSSLRPTGHALWASSYKPECLPHRTLYSKGQGAALGAVSSLVQSAVTSRRDHVTHYLLLRSYGQSLLQKDETGRCQHSAG